MAETTSDRFRRRARECRLMAAEVMEPDWQGTLLAIAQDLEDEADEINRSAVGAFVEEEPPDG